MTGRRKITWILIGSLLLATAVAITCWRVARSTLDLAWLKEQRGVWIDDRGRYEGLKGTTRRFFSMPDNYVTGVAVNQRELNDDLAKAISAIRTCGSLRLNDTTETDAFLARLRKSAALTYVELSDTDVSALGFKELSELERLSELRLEYFFELVSGKALIELHGNASIEYLTISGMQLDDDSLAALASFRKLRHLSLSFWALREVVQFPPACEALEVLDISGDSIGPRPSKWIADHSRLESLFLRHCELRQADWDIIANHKMLLAVNVEGGGYDVQQLRAFANTPQLEGLGVIDCGQLLDAEFLKSLGSWKALSDLGMDSNRIEAGALRHLKDCQNLTSLSLKDCKLGGDQVTELFTLKALRWLDLAGNDLTSEQIEALQKQLPDCKIIYPQDRQSSCMPHAATKFAP